MLRFLLGAFLVAVVSWAWSVLFYVVSPVPYYTSRRPRRYRRGRALRQHFPETGTYILPGRAAGDEVAGRCARGPMATVYIRQTAPRKPRR